MNNGCMVDDFQFNSGFEVLLSFGIGLHYLTPIISNN
jgi:hypothetical protein